MGNPLTTFRDQGVQPPSRFYITQSEFLVLKILSSVANPALTVTSRVIGPDGEVVRNLDAIGAVTAGTISTQLFKLGEGFLLDVCVSNYGGTVRRGQTYVSVGIQFGAASGQTPFECLAADYVTNTCPLGWPGGAIRSSVDGPGIIVRQVSAVPAAGAELSYTVPTGVRQRIVSGFCQLTCSAVAQDRQISLIIDDGTNIMFQVFTKQNATAGSTKWVSLNSGTAFQDTGDSQIEIGIPVHPVLLQGYRLRTQTFTLDVGDQFTALNLLVEQWIEA
jgi:hypothetical protein